MAVATSTAIAYAALAATAVGAGVQAYGQYQQGKTARKVGEFNAKVAENQAIQADMDARENMRRKRAENKRALSMQRARFAKSGVAIGTGTPLEVQAETAGLLEMEALEIGRQGEIRKNTLLSQGKLERAAGRSAYSAGLISGGATLLSGAGQTAYMGSNFKQAGVI